MPFCLPCASALHISVYTMVLYSILFLHKQTVYAQEHRHSVLVPLRVVESVKQKGSFSQRDGKTDHSFEQAYGENERQFL